MEIQKELFPLRKNNKYRFPANYAFRATFCLNIFRYFHFAELRFDIFWTPTLWKTAFCNSVFWPSTFRNVTFWSLVLLSAHFTVRISNVPGKYFPGNYRALNSICRRALS